MDTNLSLKKRVVTKEDLMAYKNPDSRCTYPFTPDPVGYCWSYAHHVDGTPKFEDMSKICPGCDMWKPDSDHYSQLDRTTTPKPRNEVAFIRDVLKARELNGNGVYQHTDALLVSAKNQWELGGRFFQHVTIMDGVTVDPTKDTARGEDPHHIDIVIENYDPTMCITDDDCGIRYDVKLRWQGSPYLCNLQGIIGKPTKEQGD